MATTPSARKLTPFYVRPKDMNKESATLFYRIHTRKIDALISTLLQVGKTGADWDSAPEQAGTLLMVQI